MTVDEFLAVIEQMPYLRLEYVDDEGYDAVGRASLHLEREEVELAIRRARNLGHIAA